jgi:hypothetical protein
MLLDGTDLAVWALYLQEGEKGRRFRFHFGALNQCSFRLRMSMEYLDQNRWLVGREGAFLKPTCGGDRVDIDKVDRMSLEVMIKSPKPVRWCMTDLRMTPSEPAKIDKPVLPKGPLVDEMGQSTIHEWPGRTRSLDELKTRVRRQLWQAPKLTWPTEFTRWGGWRERKLGDATGFFRTQKAGGRWWLVDPDGFAFWSTGLDCVRVDCESRIDGMENALKWTPPKDGAFKAVWENDFERDGKPVFVNYLAANMIRALGEEAWRDKWAQIALAEMKRLRFNTVANWSEWEFAAKAHFPYVRPMEFRGKRCGTIYRDFPDVFHTGFDADTEDYASQLKPTANDPAFIGYFLMNEPTWAFSTELPAVGMLYTSESCATRDELAKWLRAKYDGDAALSAAWKAKVTFDNVAKGRWKGVFSKEALDDLQGFSKVMVEKYFTSISKACKRVDPHHLNLGMRWAGVPPEWAVEGMKSFDVFSLNCYMDRLPRDRSDRIHQMLGMPVMVGEWHFGALDAGLPASGIGHNHNQAERAKAYRVYLEDAAANPNCVGVHWFTLYDESAIGRFDGENYNIGFLDICNRPYDEMCSAAIASHERMYQVAMKRAEPFSDVPVYLPKLFI